MWYNYFNELSRLLIMQQKVNIVTVLMQVKQKTLLLKPCWVIKNIPEVFRFPFWVCLFAHLHKLKAALSCESSVEKLSDTELNSARWSQKQSTQLPQFTADTKKSTEPHKHVTLPVLFSIYYDKLCVVYGIYKKQNKKTVHLLLLSFPLVVLSLPEVQQLLHFSPLVLPPALFVDLTK